MQKPVSLSDVANLNDSKFAYKTTRIGKGVFALDVIAVILVSP